MIHAIPVRFTVYGPGTFPTRSPFAPDGYLFTVPGTYPNTTHPFTDLPDQQMAVYRTRANGAETWEVRETGGEQRALAEAPSRRRAVAMSILEIARRRTARTTEIIEQRVQILGLEPTPPYAVEPTGHHTLVYSPEMTGVLDPGTITDHTSGEYPVTDIITGQRHRVPITDAVALQCVTAAALHARCSCTPTGATWFETRDDAMTYAQQAYNALSTCPQSEAPTVDPAKAKLFAQFEAAWFNSKSARKQTTTTAAAYVAYLIRRYLPTATTLTVHIATGELRTIHDHTHTPIWHAPASPFDLPDHVIEETEDTIRGALQFGTEERALTESGWITPSADYSTYDLPLPAPH